MTLGERLQQLRKEQQMSQEDLGNLLLVSRQTVSLWENNQTVPTVDNLIRLKEIFGVSIDSILTGEEPAATEVAPEASEAVQTEEPNTYYYTPPFESIFFSLQSKDLKYIYRLFNAQPLKKLIVWIFILFFSIFVTFADSTEEQNSYFVFWLAFIFFCLVLIKYIQSLHKAKKAVGYITSHNYAYEMYHNYMITRVFKGQDEIKTFKTYLNGFKRCWETPYCYFLERNDNTIFTIKKAFLSEHSSIGYFCQQLKTSKTDFSSVKVTLLKTSGHALFIGCFISFLTAMVLIGIASEPLTASSQQFLDHLRTFHYFLPVPIASIIVGILLNLNKIRNKKNIIAGVVIGLLMLIYGFFPTIFANIDNNLESLEAKLGFELPEHISYSSTTTTGITGEKQRVINLSFTESASNEFEAFILEDERWSEKGKEGFSSVYPPSKINVPYDLFLIYNVTTNEFGKLPDSDGKYEFIYIAYDTEMNTAYIFEYTLDYQSQH